MGKHPRVRQMNQPAAQPLQVRYEVAAPKVARIVLDRAEKLFKALADRFGELRP